MSAIKQPLIAISGRQRRFASWVTDVLVYIVVLNLFVEFSDAVVIDSFWISILTAVLLKAMLDAIIGFEHRVATFFDRHEGSAWRIGKIAAAWGILFLSKFVILEAVDIVFGDEVELGKLLDVILLVVALMVARALFERAYSALAPTEAELTGAGIPASAWPDTGGDAEEDTDD
ncbi:MAG: hypothetical protein ACR2OH_08835 [Microthrixaceae bacterium]